MARLLVGNIVEPSVAWMDNGSVGPLSVCSRVVVSYMGKNYFRNFLAPNPGICEVPGENHPDKIIFESNHIYPVLNDLEVSPTVI